VLGLSQIFESAAGVLVYDEYLRSHTSAGITPVEVLARISISGWQQRLWTFSEGQLAQRIWFQFRDQAIDLYSLTERWQDSLKENRLPARASTSVQLEMTALYTATTLLQRHRRLRVVLHLDEIRTALSTRQTSWKSDEPLCLAAVLQIDLSRIIEAADDDKMAAFWQQLEYLPAGIVFAPISPKLDNIGSRWAPASLLGGENNQEPWWQRIDSPDAYARPSPHGIIVMLPAITFVCSLDSSTNPRTVTAKGHLLDLFFDDEIGPGDALHFRHRNGVWLRCFVKKDWHQNSLELDDYDRLPVLLLDLQSHNDDEKKFPHPDGKGFYGLFVTYLRQEREAATTPDNNPSPIRANAHRHVLGSILPLTTGAYLDRALECAQNIWADHQHEIEPFLTNPTEEGDKLLWDKLLAWVGSHPMKDELFRTYREVYPAHNDLQHLINSTLDVQYFLSIGDWYSIEGSAGQRWCID
jgi:hypothetical protein